MEFNKRKLQIIDQDQKNALLRAPKSFTHGGQIGNFYPMNRINRVLQLGADESASATITSMPGADSQKRSKNAEYRELLMNLIKQQSSTGGRPRNNEDHYHSNNILPSYKKKEIVYSHHGSIGSARQAPVPMQ